MRSQLGRYHGGHTLRILILGLRRSGTTIFWQMFRQDARLLAVNEPFNPALSDMPLEIPNRSRRELIEIFREDPEGFWRRFAPIATTEELHADLSDRQQAWLRFLLDRQPGFVMDATRCHFKLGALQALARDAVVVHLHRGPAAVASSHLVPSGSGGFRGKASVRAWGRLTFWSRSSRFDAWGVQSIASNNPESFFGQRMRELGSDPAPLYQLPAVARLMAYWRLMYERIEADGPRLFGDRFLSVSFEEFCDRPREIVGRVYRALGEEASDIDTSQIHPPHGPHRPQDPRWRQFMDAVGIPQELRDV